MNRLDQTISKLQQQHRTGLICYFTAGDPDFSQSVCLLSQLGRAGADIIEIGVPFSDPIADGEIIQAAHARALHQGQTMLKTIQLIQQLRQRDPSTPIVLMSYFNPVMQYGFEKLITATALWIDGLILLDLPDEYKEKFQPVLQKHNIHLIAMTAPTTTPKRLAQITQQATGFIYHVAENGTTGGVLNLPQVKKKLAQIKPHCHIPVAVGFGISSETHVSALANHVDFIIIGSALVDTLFHQGISMTLQKVNRYAKLLRNPTVI